MALMVLVRLPTESELESTSMEAHTFLDTFNKHAVSPFVAKVNMQDGCAELDGWLIGTADWFQLIDC